MSGSSKQPDTGVIAVKSSGETFEIAVKPEHKPSDAITSHEHHASPATPPADINACASALINTFHAITIGNDAAPRQRGPMRNALIHYDGPINEGEQTLIDLGLQEDREMLDDLRQLANSTEAEGMPNLERFLKRHKRRLIRAIKAHDKNDDQGLSPLLNPGWLTAIYGSIAWQMFAALKGVDRSFLVAIAPTILRSIPIMWDRSHENSQQTYDMFEQRFVPSAPSLVLYSFTTQPQFKDFYHTGTYYGLSIGLNALVVAGIIVRKEAEELRDRSDIKKAMADLETANPGAADRLCLTAEEYVELGQLIVKLRKTFRVSPGTAGHFTHMMSEFGIILTALKDIAETEEGDDDDENPDEEEKWAVVVLGGIIVSFAMGATARNPVNLAGNASWAAYFLYRLIKSARNHKHHLEDTLDILSQAGATVVFTFFTVYIPLIAGGPNVFEDNRVFIPCLVLQIALNVVAGHRVGPLFRPALMPVVKKLFEFMRAVGVMKRMKVKTSVSMTLPAAPDTHANFGSLAKELGGFDLAAIEKDAEGGLKAVKDLTELMQAQRIFATTKPEEEEKEEDVLLPSGNVDVFSLMMEAQRKFEAKKPLTKLEGEPAGEGEERYKNWGTSSELADLLSLIDIHQDVKELERVKGVRSVDKARSFLTTVFAEPEARKALRQMLQIF